MQKNKSTSSGELNKKLLLFISQYQDTPKTTKQKETAITKLLQNLADRFCNKGEELTAHHYGSYAAGISTKEGDVDICLQFPEKQMKKLSTPTKQKKIVFQIVDGIREGKFAQGFKVEDYVIRSQVPYVRLFHNKLKVHLDVSFNMTGVMTARLIKAYIDLDLRIQPFILFIKIWASAWNIVGSGGQPYLSSFAFVLLAIAYLQEIGFIPSLQQLVDHPSCDHDQDLVEPPHSIDGCDTRFFANLDYLHEVWKGPNETKRREFSSIGVDELVRGFLDFYTKLDFTTSIIDVKSGKIQPRQIAEDETDAPLMCILGPIDGRDKGRAVRKKQFAETMQAFQQSDKLAKEKRPLQELVQG